MKDLIDRISPENLRAIKENQRSFSKLLTVIIEQGLTNDSIIDLIGEQSYKTFINELERIIKLQGIELVGAVKDLPSDEKKEYSNQFANVGMVSGNTTEPVTASGNEQRINDYMQPTEFVGTIEQGTEYEKYLHRDAEIQPIYEYLGTGKPNESERGAQRNEPNNMATDEKTDLGGISSDASKSNPDVNTDIKPNSRTMERVINNKRAEIEAKMYGTTEKKEALQILRENYDYPFKCPKGLMNSLAKHFCGRFGGSLSTWCNYIRSVQQTDEITSFYN